jgi:monoterpene epsilon-lactone hydrolase
VASAGARIARLLARTTTKAPIARSLHRPDFVRRYRAVLAQMSLPFGRPPRGVACRPATSGVAGEWLTPQAASNATIFYLHGGGYVAASPAQYRSLTGGLARASGAQVFALEYRLAPEHPFPAALHDAVAGYRALLEAGRPPSKIVIGGDSAGGGLALALAIALRDRGVPLPAGVLLFSPWVDLAATGASIRSNAASDDVVAYDEAFTMARLYADGRALDDPEISPLYADLHGLPPLLAQASEIEMLRDDAVRLVQRALDAGTPATLQLWNGVPHVWQLFSHVREAREAVAAAAAFIRQVTESGSTPS